MGGTTLHEPPAHPLPRLAPPIDPLEGVGRGDQEIHVVLVSVKAVGQREKPFVQLVVLVGFHARCLGRGASYVDYVLKGGLLLPTLALPCLKVVWSL